MPTVEDLERIVDRLKWSWEHLQNYKLALVDAQVGYHWIPVAQTDSQGRRYTEFVVDEATPLPTNAHFIIGDSIHNLRASLDNLIYSLHPGDRIEFPICLTRNQWRKQAWKIKHLPKGPTEVLFDLQPFQPKHANDPEGCPLWILDRLWNDDKHRAPHLVMGISDAATLHVSPPGWDHAVTCLGGPLEIDSVVAKVWWPADRDPGPEANFGFDVAFDALGPARGRSVYYCLVDLHKRVAEIVELFRPFFK
jgi:hypothetical protein